MKNERTLKKVLIVLSIILLTVFSLIGVYFKEGNSFKNLLPDYSFGKNLSIGRVITLKPDDSVDTKSASTTETTNTETPEESTEKLVNPVEVLNKENFEKCKTVMNGRLEKVAEIKRDSTSVAFREDIIKMDYDNGQVILEFPDKEEVDNVIESLTYRGKIEVVDSETKETLLTSNNLKDVTAAVYVVDQKYGTKAVFLTFEFDSEGKKILRDITKNYVTVPKDENNTANTVGEGTENAVAENTAVENTTAENTATPVEKKITLRIEGEDVLTTNFDEEIKDGKLQLSIGSASTDVEQLRKALTQAQEMSILLSSGEMPVKYKVVSDVPTMASSSDIIIKAAEIVFALVFVAIVVFLIAKYKKLGLCCALSYIGTIALTLLLVRVLKLTIVVETMAVVGILLFANTYLIINILRGIGKDLSRENIGKAIKKGYKDFIDIGVILLLIGVIFTFTKWVAIESIGTITFWGLISILISNIIFTNTLLLNSSDEK